MRIIPAIDIIGGQCVRLNQGRYDTKTVYSDDPLSVAKQFEEIGCEYLHLVDLDGARAGGVVHLDILRRIVDETGLQVDFGGGVKTQKDVDRVLEAGASQITIGSLAVKEPDTFLSWLETYGADTLILGADARYGFISTDGWEVTSDVEIGAFVNGYASQGVKYCVCTDISRDGQLSGPAFEMYEQLLVTNPGLQLIASGGVAEIEDLDRLQEIGMEGAIIGKAIYEGKIEMDALEKWMTDVV